MMAPRAKAIASGRPGTSQCATRPTATVVKVTRPTARRRIGRFALASSRSGISQPSENRSGGRKQRKKKPGSSSKRGNPGRKATPMPPDKVGDELRPGQPAPDDAQARDHQQQQEGVLEGYHSRWRGAG